MALKTKNEPYDALDECIDDVITRASQRCDRAGVIGKGNRSRCARAESALLNSIRSGIISNEDLFKKGPFSKDWKRFLQRSVYQAIESLEMLEVRPDSLAEGDIPQDRQTRGQVEEKVGKVLQAAAFDFDRCLAKSWPVNHDAIWVSPIQVEKSVPSMNRLSSREFQSLYNTSKQAFTKAFSDLGEREYNIEGFLVFIHTSPQSPFVKQVVIEYPDGSAEYPIFCKDGSIAYDNPALIPREVQKEVERLFKLLAEQGKKFPIGSCRRGSSEQGSITNIIKQNRGRWMSNL